MTAVMNGAEAAWKILGNKFPVIALGVAVAGAVGYVAGGSSMGWLVAKISGLVLGMIFSLSQYQGASLYMAGSMVVSMGVPFLAVHLLEMIFRGRV